MSPTEDCLQYHISLALVFLERTLDEYDHEYKTGHVL